MKTRTVLQTALVAIVLHFYGVAEACPVCINGAGGERLTDAFNWSVIFLMAMPYTILFSIVGFFVYAYRRAAKKARAEEPHAEEMPVLNPAPDLS
jgi:heme/copper-type cytochrome/quinol oxidase subunit 2